MIHCIPIKYDRFNPGPVMNNSIIPHPSKKFRPSRRPDKGGYRPPDKVIIFLAINFKRYLVFMGLGVIPD